MLSLATPLDGTTIAAYLGIQGVSQLLHRRQHVVYRDLGSGNVHGGGERVIGRLAAIHCTRGIPLVFACMVRHTSYPNG